MLLWKEDIWSSAICVLLCMASLARPCLEFRGHRVGWPKALGRPYVSNPRGVAGSIITHAQLSLYLTIETEEISKAGLTTTGLTFEYSQFRVRMEIPTYISNREYFESLN